MSSASNENPQARACHLCYSNKIEIVEEYQSLWRVTSDCRPWHRKGELAHCHECQTSQAPITAEWLSEVEDIYANYSPYAQAGGAEQLVFEQGTGAVMARSDRLVDHLLRTTSLPSFGRVLDIGCGNGAFLRAFGHRLPHWKMSGTESTDRNRSSVERIEGVEAFYVGELPCAPRRFELISMIHVLEHIPDPLNFLRRVRDLLSEDGTLLLQVPDFISNPFELIIADHCTHFSHPTIHQLVLTSRFEPLVTTGAWVSKEISVVARRPDSASSLTQMHPCVSSYLGMDHVKSRVRWLTALIQQASQLEREGRFGIFGTSIAASWLSAHCPEGVDFFVDEDTNRVDRLHLNRPVYRPQSAPKNCPILVALPPQLGASVVERLARTQLRFVLPRDL